MPEVLHILSVPAGFSLLFRNSYVIGFLKNPQVEGRTSWVEPAVNALSQYQNLIRLSVTCFNAIYIKSRNNTKNMLCTERTGGQMNRGQQGKSYGWVSEWWGKLGVQTYKTELEIAICKGSKQKVERGKI